MKRLWRLWHSFVFACKKGEKKAAYARKHHLFAEYGDDVVFQPHLLPLYSSLIKIHDHVVIGRNVEFVTHDVIHKVLNASPLCGSGSRERIGCIEVEKNVFVGNGTIIMYGVRIRENCIIAAGSVVTKSTESNSVYAGVPARKIGEFQEAANVRLKKEESGAITVIARNQSLTNEEIKKAWALFDKDNS